MPLFKLKKDVKPSIKFTFIHSLAH
ncbi:uncharacterized protein METZ01_LOCUS501253, partial [marine metagenome]